ncbi:MAG: hypothetical protein FK733_10255 [Asgard group archaeon]|nr:hypothetical protein [Asgard group archaeon]
MKSQMDQLQSEAEANYSASRWEDSAKTYEHLVGLAQQNNELDKAVTFALAAIQAWGNLPNMHYRINRLYQAIGLIGLKKAAIGFESLAVEAEKTNDNKNAAAHYEEAGNNYSLIQSYEKAKNCYQKAAEVFEELSSKASKDNDHETTIHLMSRICGLYTKLGTLLERLLIERRDLDKNKQEKIHNEKNSQYKNAQEMSKKKALAHEKLAQFYLSKKDTDCNRIAVKEYKTAIDILESLGETQEAKKFKSKLDKIPK